MEERKRFQNQTLNSADYEKTEEGAQAVKNGGKVIAALALAVGVCIKYGPELIRSIGKIHKI